MFLTRIGKNSRMSLSGDVTQIDLEREVARTRKGFINHERYSQIGNHAFRKEDITRHPLVSVIVDKFEEYNLDFLEHLESFMANTTDALTKVRPIQFVRQLQFYLVLVTLSW